jgi:uncharacterized membrane protein YcaP (DUF421 family)
VGREDRKRLSPLFVKNGEIDEENLQKTHISKDDIMEGVRVEITSHSLEDVKEIFMEKTGQISVVKESS